MIRLCLFNKNNLLISVLISLLKCIIELKVFILIKQQGRDTYLPTYIDHYQKVLSASCLN